MPRQLLIIILILAFVSSGIAQATGGVQATEVNAEKKKDEEAKAKLTEQYGELLHDALNDVNNLHSVENRISFTSEFAALMWFVDEKEARAAFDKVLSDFRSVLSDYDGRMAAYGTTDDKEMYEGGLFADLSSRASLLRRFDDIMNVRRQIAANLAEHDGELALQFYDTSLTSLTNPELQKRAAERDAAFLPQLTIMMSQSNPAIALKFAERSLSSGLNYNHPNILKKLYAKDPEKGIVLAGKLLSKAAGVSAKSEESYVVSALLVYGDQVLTENAKRTDGRKPVYTADQLRELSEMLGRAILDGDLSGYGIENIKIIEKYSPSRAGQIRAKFKSVKSAFAANGANSLGNGEIAIETDAETSSYAANSNSAAKAAIKKAADDRQALDDVKKLGSAELPEKDRQRIYAEARKIVDSKRNSYEKIAGLSMLAMQIAPADKKLASALMQEAQAMAPSNPKNYIEMAAVWSIVSGYSAAEPEKAFPILGDAIGRLNDTISGFVKAAEFIDVGGEMVDDGEIRVGTIGGGMSRQILSMLGQVSGPTIGNLARADFQKLRSTVNGFERPEVRILAKAMVLRAVAKQSGISGDVTETEDDGGSIIF